MSCPSRSDEKAMPQPSRPSTTTVVASSATTVKVIHDAPEIISVSTDSTPVSSDVEHSHTSSPRKSCQRKRKERRDSIGEGQDKKFSKSSSDVFPSCVIEQGSKNACTLTRSTSVAEEARQLTVRRVRSTIDFVTNNNQEDCCAHQKQTTEEPKKCTFYVSDDEVADSSGGLQDAKNGCERSRRAIMRPRRSRKARTDSLKENREQQDEEQQPKQLEEKQPKSPVLPWKKSSTVAIVAPPSPLSMSTASMSPASSVLGLVTAFKSSIVQDQLPEADNDSKDSSDSTSSSTSDETLSNLDLGVDNSSSDSNSTSFSLKNMSPPGSAVQDQPISWEPYGALWKDPEDLDDEARDEFQSTRHFGILNSRQHLDRNHWNQSYQETKSKIKQLSKQLSVVRKKIEEFEVQFEDTHGYRPSQAEKQNNKEIRKLTIQHNRLKRQIRICRESGDSGVASLDNNGHESPAGSPTSSDMMMTTNILHVYSDEAVAECNNVSRLKSVVSDIEEKLQKDRQVSGRPSALDEMTQEQIIQEKQCIQIALNQVQAHVMNTPATAEEKLVLKDLLMRYRSVKRLVRRSSNVLIKDPCELETIPEGAEIQLTLASPQHRINIEMNTSPSRIIDQADLMPADARSLPRPIQEDNDNEPNLHAMTRNELVSVQRSAKEEKKQLRRGLKEKEAKFLDENGRAMPKDELKEHDYYAKYKMTKAKLKLVDALLSKFVK